ncbi:unnamed protein product, partial [Polarella glacialis]
SASRCSDSSCTSTITTQSGTSSCSCSSFRSGLSSPAESLETATDNNNNDNSCTSSSSFSSGLTLPAEALETATDNNISDDDSSCTSSNSCGSFIFICGLSSPAETLGTATDNNNNNNSNNSNNSNDSSCTSSNSCSSFSSGLSPPVETHETVTENNINNNSTNITNNSSTINSTNNNKTDSSTGVVESPQQQQQPQQDDWCEGSRPAWRTEALRLLQELRTTPCAPECLESVDEYLKPAGTSCSGKLFAAPPTGKKMLQLQLRHLELQKQPELRRQQELQQQLRPVLEELLCELDGCLQQLLRLRVDLECLDDGGAESLFSSPGRLRQELAQLDWVCDECDELQDRARGWSRCAVHAFGSLAGKDALASFLEEALADSEKLQRCCQVFCAKRQAAVARAKAAIEAMDAEERASAAGLLAEALAPGSRVDFPCVTEICQRVADRPAESRRGMDLLFSALADKATHQDARRRKLKALTIAHELLYDENVLQEFASRPLEPLILLESLAECSGLGEQAEETIRMLASEVRRRVEAKVLLAEEEETIERSVHRAVTWAFPARQPFSPTSACTEITHNNNSNSNNSSNSSQKSPIEIPLWDGEGQGSMRGRTGAEALAKHLRRWGSWNRWGSGQEQLVLGDVRGTFQKLVATLARLHEELDCLNDGSTRLPIPQQLKQIAPLLLAASDVHVRAVTWGEAVASAQHRSSVAATVLGAVTGATKSSLDSKLLSDFLEEALAASDELKRRCYRFAAVRNEAVERAKAAIEAAGVS